MPPLLTRPSRRPPALPRRRTPDPAPPLAPMAPIAVDPGVVRAASPAQRQRWVLAAAVAGVMLTSQVVQRHDDPAQLADGATGAVDVDLTHAPYVGSADQPLAMGMHHPLPPDDVVVAEPVAAPAVEDGEAVAEEAPAGALPDGPAEVARYGDVRLITEGSSVELVGFHEASSPAALTLGTPELTDEGPVIALPTRGRPNSPTSAVDVAMTPGAPVPAPVDGEVIAVGDYHLYGSTVDTSVRIRPDADPDIVVTVVHVEGPKVAIGDRVAAGTTPIAAEARQLPFDSQIDRFTAAHRGEPAPHIHLELRHA